MNNSISTPGLLSSGFMTTVDLVASPVKEALNAVKT